MHLVLLLEVLLVEEADGGRLALEEEPQFLVLVEGSRGAAHDLGLDGLGQRKCQKASGDEQKERSHFYKRVMFLFVFFPTRVERVCFGFCNEGN